MDFSGVVSEFIAEARNLEPLEACGLIYVFKGRPRLRMCANFAEDPERDFAISPNDYAMAEELGEVVGVIHSHPNSSAEPSPVDCASHAASGLQWWIVGLIGDDAEIRHMPAVSSSQPLVGRVFVHGVADCYSLIRDWYLMERGVDLPDFARTDQWWSKGQDLYIDGFPQAGFVEVAEPPVLGDVLLMNIGANVCNHAAIFCGGDKILHHLHGRLSGHELYSSFYRDRTRHVLRYAGDLSIR